MAVIKFATDNAVPGHDNYPQLEPNHLSAPRDGGVYAQLPAKDDIDVLYQGQMACYDMANGVVDFAGAGPWMLVFNEEKHYDQRKKMHRDFALKKSESSDNKIYPRLLRLSVGDVFTTNAFVDGQTIVEKDDLTFDTASKGLWKKGAGTGSIKAKAAKITTMPDGSPAVKIQIVAA